MTDDRRSRDDRKFKDDLDELLSRANPNPGRIGCLSRDSLLALAARAQPLGDPGYEHLLQCSECYREFRRFQPTRDDQES
jgi:hypothetical protein